MRTAGLRGRVARIYRPSRALNRFFHQHPNRVRGMRAAAPNQIWLRDITYIPLATQWRFLAVILDQYSRRVLAWTLARHRGARLTCAGQYDRSRARQSPRTPQGLSTFFVAIGPKLR